MNQHRQVNDERKIVDLKKYIRQKKKQRKKAVEENPAAAAQPASPKSFNTGLLSLIIVMLALILAGLISTQIFSVREIAVLGVNEEDAQNVAGSSGIALGQNIFAVNLKKVKVNLAANYELNVLGVRRVYPSKIQIEVARRVPIAAVPYLGNYLLFDENLIVTQVRPDLPVGEYVLLTGLSFSGYDLGEPLITEDGISLENFMNTYKALREADALKYISEVNIENVDRINLLTREGVVVEMGKAEKLTAKAKIFTRVMPYLRRHGYTSGVLYLTSGNDAVYSDSESVEKQTIKDIPDEEPVDESDPVEPPVDSD